MARIDGWTSGPMNQAGPEVMLKSVAMSLATYVMSCVRLPEGLCTEMTKAMAAFWWGGSKGKKKMHWMTWDKLCEKKSDGGLGFRDLPSFNLALLAKQGWRILTNEGTLHSQIAEVKVFPKFIFFGSKIGC